MQVTRLNIWCEDRAHEQFLRDIFTRAYRIESRNLIFKVAPSGKGSASQWVIAQYGVALSEAKVKKHQARLGFLVVVDGDQVGFAERKKTLRSTHVEERDENCRLAIWAPTWSIETWVQALAGGHAATANLEGTSLKDVVQRNWDTLRRRAVAAWNPTVAPLSCPSLQDALEELERL